MKVLHAPRVIANQSVILAEALRKQGIGATSLQYRSLDRDKYSADIDIDIRIQKWYQLFKPFFVRLRNFPRFLNFEIYHFHYGRTLIFGFLDLPILKLLGKKIVFEYHGSDVRNPFGFANSISFTKKIGLLAKQALLKVVSRLFVDAEVVTTPDLLEYVPSAKFIPVAVEDHWLSSQVRVPGRNGKMLIVHAPTDRAVKGSDYVVSAVKQLQKEGLPVELDLVEGVPPNDVRKHFEKADIAVDQLLIGWYGLFAVEMMALGKPVVCYIRDDLKKYAPDLPIVNVNSENIADILRQLINNKKQREELGREGEEFVRKFHSSGVVAKRFIELYKKL